MNSFEHARYASLADKRVPITGGGSGIGAAFTQAFV
jgi:NAD(P)-dependent dehydrogenase (short-subunit alcohol dehydrogenase family)